MQQKLMRVIAVAVLLIGTATISLRGQVQPPAASGNKGAAQTKPQQPPVKEEDDEVLNLDSTLVRVPFSVLDKRNTYITDLKQTDLRVLEDGKPQEIFSLVREVDLPLTISLLIDTSGSQALSLPEQRSAAIKFFKKVMRPQKDIASVISFSGTPDLVQKLTGNLERLVSAVDSIEPAFSPASVGGTPPINGDSRSGSTAIYDAVYATVDDQLSREAGRRVIILLTDGQDTASRTKMKEAIERAWRSEVQIYAIGVEGAARNGGYVEYFPVERGTLKKLCEETGGRAFFPTKDEDLYRAFQQIEDDLRQQYILSYSPGNGARDGSFRSIKVEVTGRKDLQVHHRRGYFAPTDGQTKASSR